MSSWIVGSSAWGVQQLEWGDAFSCPDIGAIARLQCMFASNIAEKRTALEMKKKIKDKKRK